MDITTIAGVVASVCTATSLLPQLFRIINKKEAEAISFGMLALLFIGLSTWIYYGVLKKDWILIISNAFSLLINIITAILSFKYKK